MLIDNKPIIGICGKKQSGKDTVASMIVYILNTGIINSSYREWYIKYKDKKNDVIRSRVTHFSDYPKDICSRAFGISREYFDDAEYKDNKYYLMDKKIFISKDKVPSDYFVANHTILKITPLAALCGIYNNKIVVTLRTLMQYIGTTIGRSMLGELCWIRPTISNAIDIRNKYGYCIIPDVRFQNESDIISKQTNSFVIGIKRPNNDKNNNEEENHISENTDSVTVNFIINNNEGLMALFYKVIELIDALNRSTYGLIPSSTGDKK